MIYKIAYKKQLFSKRSKKYFVADRVIYSCCLEDDDTLKFIENNAVTGISVL